MSRRETQAAPTRGIAGRDILNDISIELKAQRAKTLLLVAAVVFSVGALVGSIGISHNAAHQIDADLAASTLRTVSVRYVPPANIAGGASADSEAVGDGGSDGEPAGSAGAVGSADARGSTGGAPGADGGESGEGGETTAFERVYPADALARVKAIDTVEYAGMQIELSTATSLHTERSLTGYSADNVVVEAVSAEYFAAAGIQAHGEASVLDTALPVAFLGTDLAGAMGIPATADTRGLGLKLNGVAYSIAGFVTSDAIAGRTLYIPYQRGLDILGSDATAAMHLKTALGAGSQVAGVVRYAIMPTEPERFSATQVVSAEGARDSVAVQMARQATFGGLFLLFLTTMLIANSMIVSVTARTIEIGIRRALGASRRDVAAVFLGEGALVGLLGGLGGSALAVWVILLVSWISRWSAHMVWGWILLGPLLGAGIGLLASLFPALRAAKVHPAIAVRNN